ncbi:hypothetical protein C8F01DRAFT_1234702 [Mycena amicta]|nr:hypothetical protein C8F01DRAFT_1234702 [Mycena amicta]
MVAQSSLLPCLPPRRTRALVLPRLTFSQYSRLVVEFDPDFQIGIEDTHKGRETRGTLSASTPRTLAASTRSILGFFFISFGIFFAPIATAVAATLCFPAFPLGSSHSSRTDGIALFFSLYVYWSLLCAAIVYIIFPGAADVLKYQTFAGSLRYRRDHVSHMRLDRLRRLIDSCRNSGRRLKTETTVLSRQPTPKRPVAIPKLSPVLVETCYSMTINLRGCHREVPNSSIDLISAVTAKMTVEDLRRAVERRGVPRNAIKGVAYLVGRLRPLVDTETMGKLGACVGRHPSRFVFLPRMPGGAKDKQLVGNSIELDDLWQKDLHVPGQATCPDCGALKSYGTAGVANLESTHRNAPVCKKAIPKDKKIQTSMSSYFSKQPAIAAQRVPSTVTAPLPVHATSIPPGPPSPAEASTSQPSRSKRASCAQQLLADLRLDVLLLPDSIPLAVYGSGLSAFSGDPSSRLSADIPPAELWEHLNPIFHSVFGYAATLEARMELVRRGKHGLDGFLRFMEYFIVHRGLQGGMVELKIEQLHDAVRAVRQQYIVEANPMSVETAREQQSPVASPHADMIDIESIPDEPLDISRDSDSDSDIIVMTVPDPKARKGPKHSASPKCAGYVFSPSEPGASASAEYPWILHDSGTLPWSVNRSAAGVLTLRSTVCSRIPRIGFPNCSDCAHLPTDSRLAGIIRRTKDGTNERANYAYHSMGGLISILRRKDKRFSDTRLHSLNLCTSCCESGKVTGRSQTTRSRYWERTCRERGPSSLTTAADGLCNSAKSCNAYDRAAAGLYKPKSYTEKDRLRAFLLWKLGGNRVADIAHRSLGLPSQSTVRRHATGPPIRPSTGKPTVEEISANITAGFDGLFSADMAIPRPVHGVLIFDEIATEKRVRHDLGSNCFLGPCRQHAPNRVNLQFNTERDLEDLFDAVDESDPARAVHIASEATVGAIGMLSPHQRLYAARPVLISADCKRETAAEHHKAILEPAFKAAQQMQGTTGVRIVSIASDGETRRGGAIVDMTFIRKLVPASPIYKLLVDLLLMDFHVGADDLTGDKDFKHVFKRLRNRLLAETGFDLFDVHTNPSVLRLHLESAGHSREHINSVLRPDDKQDVKLSVELLKDIWTLPKAPIGSSPNFIETREAIRTLGRFYYHLVVPYICVDFSLSEQLEHLSAAAHLAMVMYRHGQKKALPTLLYSDIMIMIKNVFFCVAKAKVDDPDGSFYLVLLGTDRLEELFGILRTMVGNDRNVDVLQLAERITGCTEVANILALHPEWDSRTRRLKLPAMTRDSTDLHQRIDHIMPPSWRGDVSNASVNLLSCWNRGRRMIETECPSIKSHFDALSKAGDITILSPFGELLVKKPLDADDTEEEGDDGLPSGSSISSGNTSIPIEFEDAMAEEVAALSTTAPFPSTIMVSNSDQPLRKAKALSLMQKLRYKAASTDRLKRVAEQHRYSLQHDDEAVALDADAPYLLVGEPAATLVRCEDKLFLAIGDVVNVRVDSVLVERVPLTLLRGNCKSPLHRSSTAPDRFITAPSQIATASLPLHRRPLPLHQKQSLCHV